MLFEDVVDLAQTATKPAAPTFTAARLYTRSDNGVWAQNTAGNETLIVDTNLPAHSAVAQVMSATTTYVTPAYLVPANGMRLGTTYRFTLMATNVATANTTTILAKVGTTGTTSDTSVLTLGATGTAAVDATKIEVVLTVRSTGASGSMVGQINFIHNGAGTGLVAATGFANIETGVTVTSTAVAVNTTVANYIGVALTCSAASVLTVQSALVERVGIA